MKKENIKTLIAILTIIILGPIFTGAIDKAVEFQIDFYSGFVFALAGNGIASISAILVYHIVGKIQE